MKDRAAREVVAADAIAEVKRAPIYDVHVDVEAGSSVENGVWDIHLWCLRPLAKKIPW